MTTSAEPLHTARSGRWHLRARLALLATVAVIAVGCSGSPAGSGPSSVPSGSIHLHVSLAFDNRADEADLWNAGTISADGIFPTSRLDTNEMGVIYDGNDFGSWSATTDQQLGDFEGECNGSSDCRPCTANYGGSWPVDSVDFTVQERGSGRYVIELYLGSDNPPRTGGCDPIANGPYLWGVDLTILLTGIGSATPSGTVTGWRMGSGSDNTGAGGYTVEVSQ